jgi:peptide/nickel transport system substrate-binding protein
VPEKQPSKWRQLPKTSFSSKELSRRMKKMEGATVKHARRFVVQRWSNAREVRRHIAIWVLAIGLIIGASGLQIFWYQQSYRSTANATGGTYAEGVLGPINTLNPIFASTSAEESASNLLFSRLLTYDASGTLNYDLAESFTMSENQRTYTVKLRPDAMWHDGLFVRAKDVVFTVNLIKNPATRSTISGWNDIRVKAIDDLTVAFSLPAVYAPFPHALNYLPILPEHLLRDVEPSALRENAFSNAPVGSGPFTLRFVQGLEQRTGRKIIHLAHNDTYYKGAPNLERFQLHIYSTTDELIRGLNTSEIIAATDLTVTDTEQIPAQRYSIDERPVNSGVYTLFNTTTGVMSDVKVRQALQAGTDTEALRSVVSDKVPALSLPFINGQVGGELPSAPSHDPERAGELLDEAGWRMRGTSRQKDGQVLKLSLVTTKNNDLEKVLAELTKQWRALGVSVTTNIVDPSDPSQNVVQDILQPRAYDALLYRLTIGADPDVYAYWHSSQANRGLNFSNYTNSIADEALASARGVTAKDLRDAKYRTFARQWLNDAPAIGIYQSTSQYAYTDAVHAAKKGSRFVTATDRYNDVRYWSVGSRVVHQTP